MNRGRDVRNRHGPVIDAMRVKRPDVPRIETTLALTGMLLLGGCAAPVRPGPMIDPAARAPFAIADIPTPTQAQVQKAVDKAVQRDGLPGVFPRFSALAPERLPTRVTLFACSSAIGDQLPRRSTDTRASVICHVDITDQSGSLVGRTTMRFTRQLGAWVLVGDREREFDAR